MKKIILFLAATFIALTSTFSQSLKSSDSLFDLGKKEKNIDIAIHYYQKAIQAAGNDSMNLQLVKIYNMLGSIDAQIKFDYKSALYNFQKVNDIGVLLDDKTIISKADISLANVYLSQGKYESALAHYLKALKVVEKSGD